MGSRDVMSLAIPRGVPEPVVARLLSAEPELPPALRRVLTLSNGERVYDTVEPAGLVLHKPEGWTLLAHQGVDVSFCPLLYHPRQPDGVAFVGWLPAPASLVFVDFSISNPKGVDGLVDRILSLRSGGEWVPLWAQEWTLTARSASSVRSGRSAWVEVTGARECQAALVAERRARYQALQRARSCGSVIVGAAVPPPPLPSGAEASAARSAVGLPPGATPLKPWKRPKGA